MQHDSTGRKERWGEKNHSSRCHTPTHDQEEKNKQHGQVWVNEEVDVHRAIVGNEKPAGQASPRKKSPPPGRNENAEASGNLTRIMSNLKEQGQYIAKLVKIRDKEEGITINNKKTSRDDECFTS